MSTDDFMAEQSTVQRGQVFYLVHIAGFCAQAAFALVLLLRAPSEAESAFFAGYSLEKLLLLSVPSGMLLAGITLGVNMQLRRDRRQRLNDFLTRTLHSGVRRLLVFLCIVVSLAGFFLIAAMALESFFVLAPPETGAEVPLNTYLAGLQYARASQYLLQLQPLIYLLTGVSLQTILFNFGLRGDVRTRLGRARANGVHRIISVYGVFLILWALLDWGSAQFQPDLEGYSWHPLGVPVMDQDVLLALLIGLILVVAGTAGQKLMKSSGGNPEKRVQRHGRYADGAIIVLLWIGAAILWASFPAEPNWFVAEPAYPNFELYPKSDALKYDLTGQNMLLGENLLLYGVMMHKPLYAAFLAFLHRLAGPGLEEVALLQSALFAVFPVFVYLLTKNLHSRLAGLLASVLAILREANSIVLTSEITVSNSRQLMTDTPAAIGIILVLIIFYRWLEKPNQYFWLPVIIGGLIASLMQVRNELLLLLPIVLGAHVLLTYRKPGYWVKTAGFMILGFSMTFLVWQFRSMYFSGEEFLDSSRVFYAIREGEVRSSNSPEGLDETPGSSAGPLNAILRNFPSHFIHNQKQAFLIFPGAFRGVDSLIGYSQHGNTNILSDNCCSRENYIARLGAFWAWQKWDGQVPPESLTAILSTLFLLSVGIVRSKEKLGLRALLPLLVVLAFYILFSIFRMSGGRRVQVVDWVWIMYYGIGLAQLVVWIFSGLTARKVPAWLSGSLQDDREAARRTFISPDPAAPAWKPVFFAGLVVFLLSVLVPVMEQVIPSRYDGETRLAWTEAAVGLDGGEVLREFLDNGGVAWQGLALYPRYTHVETADRAFFDEPPAGSQALRFSLAGPNSLEIVLSMERRGEFRLANSSDVLVIGCPGVYRVDALAVYVVEEDRTIFRDPLPEQLICPLPADD